MADKLEEPQMLVLLPNGANKLFKMSEVTELINDFGQQASSSDHAPLSPNDQTIKSVSCGSKISKPARNNQREIKDKNFPCPQCTSKFTEKRNLTAHLKSKHGVAAQKKIKNFLCDECGAQFTQKNHFYEHRKKKHGTGQRLESGNCKCPLCPFCSKKKDVMHHFEEKHGIKIDVRQRTFNGKEDFQKWKSETEKETKSLFSVSSVKSGGEKKKNTYYNCHRSGFFKSRGKDQREIKLQGSKKINGFCPANMKLISCPQGKYKVVFTSTHVGHGNELQHLSLTKEQTENLAVELATGINHKALLRNVWRTMPLEGPSERIHLLTDKDLRNIEYRFNLKDDGVHHSDDAYSVDAFVKESKRNNVLYYKPLGEEKDNFGKEIFILVMMDDKQANMLVRFGPELICTDGTHNFSYRGFQLVTVMVLDELKQGYPAAFLVTNHVKEVVLIWFFQTIKTKIGNIHTEIFMSDLEDIFYNAWENVMGEVTHRLYCTFHVDRAWRDQIKDTDKDIKGKQNKTEVYDTLRTVLEELDVQTFQELLSKTVSELKEKFPKFGEYFEKCYSKNVENWALCFRTGLGINSNGHIERFHGVIKHIYMKGKKLGRLDKSLHSLMLFVEDRNYEYAVAKGKGKISTKLSLLRKRHRKAQEISKTHEMSNYVQKTGNTWLVKSSQKGNDDFYEVKRIQRYCKCPLSCRKCNSCIKEYFCDCYDCAVVGNMCKHIHLVCIISQNIESEKEEGNEQEAPTEEDNHSLNLNSETGNTKEINERENNEKIEERLEQCKSSFPDLCSSVTSLQQVSVLEKIISEAKIKLSAVKAKENSRRTIPVFKKAIRMPPNKKIEPQRGYLRKKSGKKRNENQKIKFLQGAVKLVKEAEKETTDEETIEEEPEGIYLKGRPKPNRSSNRVKKPDLSTKLQKRKFLLKKEIMPLHSGPDVLQSNPDITNC